MGSYARQAKDDSLRKMADRIQARAIRRCGELLRQIEPARGTRGPDLEPKEGTLPMLMRESAATILAIIGGDGSELSHQGAVLPWERDARGYVAGFVGSETLFPSDAGQRRSYLRLDDDPYRIALIRRASPGRFSDFVRGTDAELAEAARVQALADAERQERDGLWLYSSVALSRLE